MSARDRHRLRLRLRADGERLYSLLVAGHVRAQLAVNPTHDDVEYCSCRAWALGHDCAHAKYARGVLGLGPHARQARAAARRIPSGARRGR